jgi:hypothetical protein
LQVAYIGFTSDGLGFYFANLTTNYRLWIVIIAEHVLLLIKVSIMKLLFSPTDAVQIIVTAMVPAIDESIMYEHEASM